MTSSKTLVLLLPFFGAGLVACDHRSFLIGDPGFAMSGTVTSPEVLDFAPVIVQAYGAADVDATGLPIAGATPFFALSAGGLLSVSQPLSFHNSTLGCPRAARIVAWADVDGSSLHPEKGNWEYEARPGAGDWVASHPPTAWEEANGNCGLAASANRGPFEIALDRRLAGAGDKKIRIDVDVTAGPAPLSTSFDVLGYRPQDISNGTPCAGCTPLVTIAKGENVWNTEHATPHRLEADSTALPMRLWLAGERDGQRYGGLVEPLLFAGEDGSRGRAAIALAVVLKTLP